MMSLVLIAALVFVSCKSQESSYKKAYEKAKAQELARNNQEIGLEISGIGDFLDGVRHLPNHQVVFLRDERPSPIGKTHFTLSHQDMNMVRGGEV